MKQARYMYQNNWPIFAKCAKSCKCLIYC